MLYELLALLGFAIVAGIRHGFDLDHIAAITDIVTSQKRSYLALLYATLYALGHGLMVIILGLVLLTIGQKVPQNLESIFGKFVGVTLITLGLYVLYSIFKYRKNFKLKSRWMLVFDTIQYGKHPALPPFGIGMIHGIGAETPTQIGAFLVLLGIGGGVKATFFLVFFVLGIFISNLAVAVLFLYGYKKALQNRNIYLTVGLITAIFSIALGIIFVVS